MTDPRSESATPEPPTANTPGTPGTSDASAQGGPPKRPAPGRRIGRRLLRLAAGLLGFVVLMAVLAAGAVVWVVHTPSGTRAAWNVAVRVLQPKLTGQWEGGTVERGVRLRDVAWHDGATVIRFDSVTAQWRLSRAPWRFAVEQLHVGTADVTLPHAAPKPDAGKSAPLPLPAALHLPLQLALDDVRIDKILLRTAGLPAAPPMEIDALRLHGGSDGEHHHLTLDGVRTAYGSARADVTLDGRAPFATQGTLALDGNVNRQPINVAVAIGGTLRQLRLDATAAGMKLAGRAHVVATPFDAVPFALATIDADHLDPQVVSPGAPSADLSVHAALRPVAPATGAASAGLVVAGPLTVTNRNAGPVDAKRLPFTQLDAQLRLDAATQAVTSFRMLLSSAARPAAAIGTGIGTVAKTKSGRTVALAKTQAAVQGKTSGIPRAPGAIAVLSGRAAYAGGKGTVHIDIAGLDLQAVHSTLRATSLNGVVSVSLDGDRQTVSAQLDDPRANIALRAAIDASPNATRFHDVSLKIGAGHANITGSLARDARARYNATAQLFDFDPMALLASAPRAAASNGVQARVTGTLEVNGELAAPLSARAKFDLHDSVYNGLPLSGMGTVAVSGQRLLPSAANLQVAGNHIVLNGAFGAPGDRLTFTIDAPNLARIGFGLAGRVQAAGDVTGSLAHPNVTAQYQADGVSFDTLRVGHAQGQAVIHDGANGALNATVDARDIDAPGLQLATLTATLAGTRAAHTLRAAARGTVHDNAIDAEVEAQGGLTDNHGVMGWHGTLSRLSNRGMPALALLAPVQVSAAPKDIEIGPTRLTLEGAALTLGDTVYRHGQIRSSGHITGIDVSRMLALQAEITGKPSGLVTDLVFDGDWDVSIGSSATGQVALRRRGGDIQVNAGQGPAALGLEKLDAAIVFSGGDQARLNLNAEAGRIGSLQAEVRTQLLLQDGMLTITPASPLSGSVAADVPTLRTTGGLLGPTYLFDGSMALRLTLAGTTGAPRVSGALTGQRLGVAMLDQGIQLRDGVVDIGITENLVTFRNVVFHGSQGTIGATGQVKLDATDPSIAAKIVADKLELFGSPDRQLSISGAATMANGAAGGGMAVDGKFTIDHALFDLPDASAPKLGDDVIIVRSDGNTVRASPPRPMPPGEKPVGPFAPRARITIDLGHDFKFKGAGADLGLVGALTVVSAPNTPLAAEGNVSVTPGSTYSTFGRKLAIETGFFTFNGPIDNPSINLLAMRRNQQVEAGVRVRGTVRAPVVQLVSEPSVTDDEKLSWLLFGHGTDSGQNAGQQNTKDAALALLGSMGGKRIAQTVGLDELTIGTSDSGLTDSQVLSVAKAINEHFVIGYEQGLQTSDYLFKLTWLLSRRWSVGLQAGTFNGGSINFTNRFD